MKLISKLTTTFNRWRKRVADIQFQDGREWAYTAYYNGGWSLEEIENQSHPFGGVSRNPFERGVLQGVIEIEREQAARQVKTNQKGEPVGVPFMIHPSNMDYTDCEDAPFAPYRRDEYEGPAFNLGQSRTSRYEPPRQFETGGLVEPPESDDMFTIEPPIFAQVQSLRVRKEYLDDLARTTGIKMRSDS